MAGKDKTESLQVDTSLVVNMVLGSMFHENGMAQVVQMVREAGKDAPAAAAHAIYVGLAQARHALEQRGIPIDNRVWTSRNGALSQVVAEVGKALAASLGKQFLSPQFLTATAQAVMQIMREQEAGTQQLPPEQPQSVEEGAPSGLLAPIGGE